ncbi:MAG: tripartite tricarboxylate transporter substrate binding protein [Betaproteobacteria bacterium]|nr:tripartite tricarboxylate transporter substrate binding protein [Betaproteobacteria bacterium]
MKPGTYLLAALMLECVSAAAWPQAYPNRPIRMIVPWPPGGGTDIFARTIGLKMTESWGQQVIIDNRPGAAGNIGAQAAAKAPADGYTLLLATLTMATSPSIYKSPGYDPLRDFDTITLIAGVPHLLVVHPSLPVKSVKELLALAKSQPGQLNYASAGNGSPFHLAGELFNLLGEVKINHVPYKGGGPAVVDVIGGQVHLTFANLVAVLPQVQAGKLRALGLTSAKRSVAAPDLPTIAEGGLPGYDFTSWFGMWSPAGTPKEIVQRLNDQIVKILRSREVKERFTRDGADVIGNSPQEFAAYVKSETAKWAKVIKEAGIRAE